MVISALLNAATVREEEEEETHRVKTCLPGCKRFLVTEIIVLLKCPKGTVGIERCIKAVISPGNWVHLSVTAAAHI